MKTKALKTRPLAVLIIKETCIEIEKNFIAAGSH